MTALESDPILGPIYAKLFNAVGVLVPAARSQGWADAAIRAQLQQAVEAIRPRLEASLGMAADAVMAELWSQLDQEFHRLAAQSRPGRA